MLHSLMLGSLMHGQLTKQQVICWQLTLTECPGIQSSVSAVALLPAKELLGELLGSQSASALLIAVAQFSVENPDLAATTASTE